MSSTVEELVVLGAFVGALLLVVVLSIVSAFTYRERGLLLHAAGTSTCVLAVEALVGGRTFLAEFAMLMVLAIDGFQLLELSSHAGALRQPRRWLVGVGSAVLPVLAVGAIVGGWHLLLPGVAAWFAVVGVIILRTWPQSQPWATWLLLGELALAAAAAWMGWRALDDAPDPPLPLAALLTLWTAAVFLAATWRNRIFSETRLRIDARNTVDPHTGLSTPIIFYDRVQAVRSLIKRYGHPSVLLLVHVENLDKLTAEFGPDIHESAMLAAAKRIRAALGDGDVAARLSGSRIGVLAEGISLAEGSSNIASRILVAGLREGLPAAPAEFLHFRIVLAAIPVNEMPAKVLLQRMAARMDAQLQAPTERRIVALTAEDLLG